MKLSAVGGTRAGADESIEGLWSFLHAQGFLTDIISERTADAGVTVDGVRLKDGILDMTDQVAATDTILEADEVGDAFRRFVMIATGALEWGSGAAARDTTLRRLAANVLDTPDTFSVGVMIELLQNILSTAICYRSSALGQAFNAFQIAADGRMQWGSGVAAPDVILRRSAANVLSLTDALTVGLKFSPQADIQVSALDYTLPAGATHNKALFALTLHRFEAPSGVANITGFSGGYGGWMVKLLNFSTNAITLSHNNGGSLVANRMMLPGGVDYVMTQGSGIELVYDSISDLWWAVGAAA